MAVFNGYAMAIGAMAFFWASTNEMAHWFVSEMQDARREVSGWELAGGKH